MKFNEKEINFLFRANKTKYIILFHLVVLLIALQFIDNEKFFEKNYICKCTHDIHGEYMGYMNCTEGLEYYCRKFESYETFYDKLCI